MPAGKKAKPVEDRDLEQHDLEWLVKSRSRNQEISFQIFSLIKAHRTTIVKTAELVDLTQSFVGITFSLWRAVFLCGDDSRLSNVLHDAERFLGILIRDNTITYTQDRNASHWAFYYYLNNARYRLRFIADTFPDYLSAELAKNHAGSPRDLWGSAHHALETAVRNFEAYLRDSK